MNERPLLGAVREARDLTQAELAFMTRSKFADTGLSQGVISKVEMGSVSLDDRRADVLAAVLDTPRELFQAPRPDPRILHNLQVSLPARAKRVVCADLEVARVHLDLMPGDGDTQRVPATWPLISMSIPEQASWVRRQLSIPDGPIASMVDLVESTGIRCVSRDLRQLKVAALGSWRHRPVLFLDAHSDDFEVRFAIAHELAHAAMHSKSGMIVDEAAADEFAYNFLLPAEPVRTELLEAGPPRALRVHLSEILRLEARWGVDAARLVHRAKQLSVMSANRHRALISELKATEDDRRKRRTDRERPGALVDAVTERTHADADQNLDDIAHAMLLTKDQLRTRYLAGSRVARRQA